MSAFLDDLNIISKGSLEQYEKEIDKTLQRLDDKNQRISLQKCKFGHREIIWLG